MSTESGGNPHDSKKKLRCNKNVLARLGLLYGELLQLNERLKKASRKKEGVPKEAILLVDSTIARTKDLLQANDD